MKLCMGLCICRSTFLLKRIFLCVWLVYRVIYPQFHIYHMCENPTVLLCGNAFPGYVIPDGLCGTGRIDHLNHYLCWCTDMDE